AQAIAAEDRAGRVEHRQDERVAVERERGQDLQRQREAAAGEHGRRPAPLEAEAQRAVAADASRRSGRIHSTTASTPTPSFRLVKTKGRSPRMRRASRSITPRSAPTYGARSILLMTRRSERVIPGPPFRGIFSPSATSI